MFVVKDGIIVVIGDDCDVLCYVYDDIVCIDLNGCIVILGLIDVYL